MDALKDLERAIAGRMNEIYAAAGVPTPSTALVPHLEEMRHLLQEVLLKCPEELHNPGCGTQYRGCSPRCIKRRIETVLGMDQ